MNHIIRFIVLSLFGLQLYFILFGGKVFGKLINPWLLFGVTMTIGAFAVKHLLNTSDQVQKSRAQIGNTFLWIMGGVLSIVVSYEEYRKLLVRFKDFSQWSDTIPQAIILFKRFSQGEYPYTPIPFGSYSLEPIYMPFHWMPTGLANVIPVDVRFIGWGFLVISAGVWGWAISKVNASIGIRVIALLLPSIVLWVFILWGDADLAITYELVIASYYLVLAAGLFSRSIWLIVVGCILCLLSRFTLIFWFPLAAYVLYRETGWKRTLIVAGCILGSLLCFYIIPFYLEDPMALKRGLAYYMGATVGDWIGMGDPPASWTQEFGISFAPVFRYHFPGDMALKVHYTRILQSVMLVITTVAGLWAYHRWRNRMDYYHFLLIALYLFMAVYFFFAPLTYRYYLIPFLMVSAVVCASIKTR